MILARVRDAAATFSKLRAAGILIKNVSAAHPLLSNCVRITIGTPEENTLLLQALPGSLT
jgi:histidinol-phosphate aminotransferase